MRRSNEIKAQLDSKYWSRDVKNKPICETYTETARLALSIIKKSQDMSLVRKKKRLKNLKTSNETQLLELMLFSFENMPNDIRHDCKLQILCNSMAFQLYHCQNINQNASSVTKNSILLSSLMSHVC